MENTPRSITVKISDRTYSLTATSEAHEEAIREAVKVINAKIGGYRVKFLGRDELDILSFVALNECITNVTLRKKLEDAGREADNLSADLERYLKKK